MRVSGQAGQDVWVWAAIDATTKIVPVLRLGPRTLHLAYAVVHELHHRLPLDCPLPVLTTDGLRLYFYALTAHFGHWRQPEDAHKPVWQIAADFVYGQVRTFQRRRRLVRVERVMLCGQRETLIQRLKAVGLSSRLNTAFVERLNLTLQQGVALLARRTWGAAQFTSKLIQHVSWWRAAARTTPPATTKPYAWAKCRLVRRRKGLLLVATAPRPRLWPPA